MCQLVKRVASYRHEGSFISSTWGEADIRRQQRERTGTCKWLWDVKVTAKHTKPQRLERNINVIWHCACLSVYNNPDKAVAKHNWLFSLCFFLFFDIFTQLFSVCLRLKDLMKWIKREIPADSSVPWSYSQAEDHMFSHWSLCKNCLHGVSHFLLVWTMKNSKHSNYYSILWPLQPAAADCRASSCLHCSTWVEVKFRGAFA